MAHCLFASAKVGIIIVTTKCFCFFFLIYLIFPRFLVFLLSYVLCLSILFPIITALFGVESSVLLFVKFVFFYHLLFQCTALAAITSAFCFANGFICSVGDVADGDNNYEYNSDEL